MPRRPRPGNCGRTTRPLRCPSWLPAFRNQLVKRGGRAQAREDADQNREERAGGCPGRGCRDDTAGNPAEADETAASDEALILFRGRFRLGAGNRSSFGFGRRPGAGKYAAGFPELVVRVGLHTYGLSTPRRRAGLLRRSWCASLAGRRARPLHSVFRIKCHDTRSATCTRKRSTGRVLRMADSRTRLPGIECGPTVLRGDIYPASGRRRGEFAGRLPASTQYTRSKDIEPRRRTECAARNIPEVCELDASSSPEIALTGENEPAPLPVFDDHPNG